jgi:flagellar biogenesis protein FliO
MELIVQLAIAGLVILLLVVALSLLKRKGWAAAPSLGGRAAAKHMVVIERVSLGPQHMLSLVEVDGKVILVGTGPGVCEFHNVVASS